MHIALKIIKRLFQNPPKIIKNLHQIASKSILQRLLWAPLMRPLAPFGGGDPRGAQIGPRLENKWKKGLARPPPWVTHFGSRNCKKK